MPRSRGYSERRRRPQGKSSSLIRRKRSRTQEKGWRNEIKVLNALRLLKLEWLIFVRLSTLEEDRKGKDIVVIMTEGEIFLQVKSSEKAAEKFREGPHAWNWLIGLVVVEEEDTPADIFKKAEGVLSGIRNKMLLSGR